jgi:hypothetical protein
MENFNKIYLEENIFYIENFISDTDIEEVLANVGSWTLRRQDHHEKISFSIFESEEAINKFKKLVEDKVSIVTNNKDQKLRKISMLQKYSPTDSSPLALGYHYENHPECDYESRWITLGVVLYLNDGYTGGELIFEHKPIEFAPKKGTLIVFPASEEYSHAVKQVTGKDRIVYSAFVYAKQYWDILNRAGFTDF